MSTYPDPPSDPSAQYPPSAPSAGSGFSSSPPPPSPEYQYTPQPGPGAGGGPPREALAGFWIRFLAALIDGFLIGLIASLLGSLFGFGAIDPTQLEVVNTSNTLQTILSLAYFTYFHATAAGQSIGNKVCGIRVLDADTGGSIPYSRAFIRALMSYVSAIVVALGYLWMLWDDRKQTWHDKVANTLVVKASAYPPGEFGRPAR
jgi:uncharacterized RDD family membrane protein YckC